MKLLWCVGFTIAAMVMVPLVAIFLSWSSINSDLWLHFYNTQLFSWFFNSLALTILVGLFVTFLGVSLAWLFVHYDFSGRSWFEWGVVLPMTLPSYVLAFIFLGIWDYAGPVQSFLRHYELTWFQINDIRNIWTLTLVMGCCLYPYSYLLAREAFLGQSASLSDASKTLGVGAFRFNVLIKLGMARTAIFSGTAMVMMEVLADFGAVAIFNFDTLTVAIYKAWFEYFDLNLACQLASVLSLIVFVSLFLQLRKKRLSLTQFKLHQMERKRLQGFKNIVVFSCLLIFLLVVFIVPIMQLIIWAYESWKTLGLGGYMGLLHKSLSLAIGATLLVVIFGLLLVIIERFSKSSVSGKIIAIVRVGYGLPGSVLAVGLIMSLGWLEQRIVPIKESLGGYSGQILIGGVFILYLSYMIRFLNVSIGPLKSAYEGISDSVIEVSRVTGLSSVKAFFLVQLPLLKAGLLTASLLVFVDVLKEMPATLLLRPFGWDTLAVRVFEMTSEGEFAQAALPALTIVLVGFIPVVLAITQSRSRFFTNK